MCKVARRSQAIKPVFIEFGRSMRKIILTCLTFIVWHCSAEYYSQYGQDELINKQFIKNKKNGFFVDIGAHDGFTYSNTYFFEKELNWRGICFEPLSKPFQELLKFRHNSICLNACVSSMNGELEFIEAEGYSEMLSGIVSTYHPLHLARLKREITQYGGNYRIIKIPSMRFNDIMVTYKINKINFLSIDTEGSELEILKSIDFNAITIDIIAVENNYQVKEIRLLLESKGYRFVVHQGDEIYVKTSLY